MGDILVGTASWADKSLLDSGLLYPKQAKTAEARLRHYATQFRLVEIDSSYYAMPAPQVSQPALGRAHAAGVCICMHSTLRRSASSRSNRTPRKGLPPDIREVIGPLAEKKHIYYSDLNPELQADLWHRFRLALDPLRRAGKLGAVLFQFPPWFFYRRTNLQHIARCAEIVEGHQLAVEFRNRTWFDEKQRDEVLAFERDHRLAQVVVDEPQGFSSSVPAIWEVTCPALAVFRLHGRNAATWEKKGLVASSEQFDYEYQETELREFLAPVPQPREPGGAGPHRLQQ